ncbi:expansin-like protein [Streptomyces odontomachi]|uniref:expansin-like protein n=1 Tax=Streptomyces odontomachi TaxID=2944940 RepID=UPI00210B4110|nr:expansin-like protein [Streptomyces sp. ODS25]
MRARIRTLAVAGVACLTVALLTQAPAGAATTPPVPPVDEPVTGNATHFDALGSPYGGCGLPQAELPTQDFVALNVYNTPGDYNYYPRPIPADQADKIGLWDNGHNCGRWVQVDISDFCTGTNDGAPSQPFCRNGDWVSDAYNGATLNMIVADSCGDSNAWCRDDPYHLDLRTGSLENFQLDGAPVTGLADHWNNRHVTWKFIPAPDYTGDIKIGFLSGAQTWWSAIAISNLPNGIHGVQYLGQDGTTWKDAKMNSDMGQSFIIEPTVSGGTHYEIRVSDVDDALLGDGRVYSFDLPASCGDKCSAAFTQTTYTTSDGSGATP